MGSPLSFLTMVICVFFYFPDLCGSARDETPQTLVPKCGQWLGFVLTVTTAMTAPAGRQPRPAQNMENPPT